MEPRITKRERKLHLSYELPHRVHASQIYSVQAPNGSTVIIYAHDRGLKILWRGGRRRKEASAPNEQARGSHLEDEEDELDPDCPYPALIQQVDLDLGVEVLHLAVPSVSTILANTPRISKVGAVALACSDGSIRALAFDLLPPLAEETQRYQQRALDGQAALGSSTSSCTDLAAKILTSDTVDAGSDHDPDEPVLLVAAVADKLQISYGTVLGDSIEAQGPATQAVHLPHLARKVSFHPSASSTQVLLTDVSGSARLYEPFAAEEETGDAPSSPSGKWLFALTSSYIANGSGLARRKQILDAVWVLSGKAILAVLEDGEFGIWNLGADSKAGSNVGEFAVRCLLGAASAGDSSHSARQPNSKLAPMTPNTRKVKSEKFFAGPAKASGAAARGGISVVTSSVRAGQTDESVVLWYGADVYAIPSLQTFWQRSTNRNNGGGLGSLYAPGLTHIPDINLMNEAIASISQFAPSSASSGVGQMNTQRDLLISAEHRLIILQALRPPVPPRSLFEKAMTERPTSRDQVMLDAGHLDIGGMDRMLDSMDARPRRVGFARSG